MHSQIWPKQAGHSSSAGYLEISIVKLLGYQEGLVPVQHTRTSLACHMTTIFRVCRAPSILPAQHTAVHET
jgi:hypothetical protein